MYVAIVLVVLFGALTIYYRMKFLSLLDKYSNYPKINASSISVSEEPELHTDDVHESKGEPYVFEELTEKLKHSISNRWFYEPSIIYALSKAGADLNWNDEDRSFSVTLREPGRVLDERDIRGLWVETENQSDAFQFLPSEVYGPYGFVRYFWEEKEEDNAVARLGFYEITEEGILVLWYREEYNEKADSREYINVKQEWSISMTDGYITIKNGETNLTLGLALEKAD